MDIPGVGLTMWMGTWTPFVFANSSNWKELRTLLLTLEGLREHHREAVRQATVFYFTDNSSTYYIHAAGSSRSPALHEMVVRLKLLEIELDCCVQVVHVPGNLLIKQGADGLSRGVWMSHLQEADGRGSVQEGIFRPSPRQRHLEERWVRELGWTTPIFHPWDKFPEPSALLHRTQVFYPPPELARQTIIFFLEAWVESPHDTRALFVVPRIATTFWHSLSRHVKELGMVYPPDQSPPLPLPIPLVVLAVDSHTPALSPPPARHMDRVRVAPANRRKHKAEAERVRKLR